MATEAQSAYNLKTAAARVSARLGLTDIADSDWTYDQRTQYNKALAQEILLYPQSFTDQTLESARRVADKDYQPLQGSDPFGEFTDAFIEEAKITLPSIGNKLLIGAVIVAVVYFGVKAWASRPAPVRPPAPPAA